MYVKVEVDHPVDLARVHHDGSVHVATDLPLETDVRSVRPPSRRAPRATRLLWSAASGRANPTAARCVATLVVLRDGRWLIVHNIAWGYDMGDQYAHITSNISPSMAGDPIDFFLTSGVREALDPAGTLLLDSDGR